MRTTGDSPPRYRRAALVGLGCYLLVAALILLAPVSYGGVIHVLAAGLRSLPGVPAFGDGWVEFVANIVLFVPMGFFLTLLFRHPAYGAVLGIAISAAVEVAQIVIPDRTPTVRDILSNSIGAAVGALIAWLIVVGSKRRLAKTATSPAGTVEPESPGQST
ncbi:VanZ family protein [Microbacterium elymi]|uniref:VanZ family protein n=1 Tax=Microbacterium elymi TaxID=2909587 RepID=A0ABY5NH53_9MICO|nr:VanZ family protein [Microbacterium elymi]UUT34497.1 VanZ family protein [Microbacterium elymi]